jgi:3-hydroxybutyryl-CoA dehydrogenase
LVVDAAHAAKRRSLTVGETGEVTIGSAGVVGLGTMGAGIVEVLARAGLDVVAVELDDALLAVGRGRLETSLQRAADRGRLAATERDAILGRVRFATERSQLAGCDLVTEAVPERLEVKTELFADLDTICGPDTILATNTSSLPVTRIAAATSRADRVVGLHFFNPAPVMRLVEVVHTVLTDGSVVTAVRDLAERCGKTPVVVGDRAGFVANALLFGYLNAAAIAAETGQAPITDIDAAMVAACGLPMGPLTLLDLIGLDVSLDVLETMYDETRDQRYAPAPLLKRLVMAGRLGRKSGAGYYRYAGREAVPAVGVASDSDRSDHCDEPGSVVVVGSPAKRLLAALADRPVVAHDDDSVGFADVVVVDGGSLAATADLAARVARRAKPEAALAVAADDEAPVATVAAGTGRAQDVVGLHVPRAPRGSVLEVVRTIRSSDAAVAFVVAALRSPELIVVPCRDRPGHLVDMLLLPHLGDAVRMVDDGYASRDDVDTAMRLGCGYSAGPFELLEALGADDVRSGLLHLAAATHRPALAPAPLLDELAGFG